VQLIRTIIMGAAGRDFHNFQVIYRDDPMFEVVAFTATQIPGIDARTYPAALAGPLYPAGIPIFPEAELTRLIREMDVTKVIFAYSDVAHVDVMHKASQVMAAGADFSMLGPDRTMIASDCPVISICAVRTGVGKSGISRYVWDILRENGLRAVDIRHPMPYRDLTAMRAERYASMEDLDRLGVTVEEREEYEPFIATGGVVMAGVDYADILLAAEEEADVIIWDGGNNDTPFIRSDLEIVALDPHRPGHERLYHPGETNFLRADVLVINKVDTAEPSNVEELRAAAARFNPEATIVETDSAVRVAGGDESIAGKKVLVIEDGPTVTHGGMAYGAGVVAAKRAGAVIVDPRPYAVGSLKDTFAAWGHLTQVLPAMGYSPEQLADLAATIAAVPCDAVLIATPIDLGRLIDIPQEAVRVTYEVEDRGTPTLRGIIEAFLTERKLCDHRAE
jgi:predicted GTPase